MTEEIQEAPVEEIVDAPLEEAPQGVADEIKEEARQYGWRDKEDFDLAPEGWVDADRFMELPSTQRKVLSDTNKALRAEMESVKTQNESIAREAAKAAKLAMDAMRRDHQAELDRLTMAQREAAESGDMEAYDKLSKQRDQIVTQPAAQPSESVDLSAHQETYPWLADPVLRNYGAKALSDLGMTVENSSAEEQFRAADMYLRRNFPDQFKSKAKQAEPKKPSHQKVDPGGLGQPAKTKGVNSLPAEAVAVGKEYVSEGVFKDMDAYAKAYWEQN